MAFQIIFILIALFLFIWNISLIISAFSGAPTVYAKGQSIQKAFELAQPKAGQVVLDVGCGNARSLIFAAKNYKTRGFGVEISPFYFLLARLNVLIKGESRNIKIYFGGATRQEKLIKKADIIYLYLFDALLSKLSPEIFALAKKNCKIISIAFPLKGRKPFITDENPKVYLYMATGPDLGEGRDPSTRSG